MDASAAQASLKSLKISAEGASNPVARSEDKGSRPTELQDDDDEIEEDPENFGVDTAGAHHAAAGVAGGVGLPTKATGKARNGRSSTLTEAMRKLV